VEFLKRKYRKTSRARSGERKKAVTTMEIEKSKYI